MPKWTLVKVLKLAISMEEESIKLYTSAQKKDFSPGSSQFLQELVAEEEKHKKKISDVIKDTSKIKEIGQSEDLVQDLKIVDYLKDVSISEDADYQQILIYAAKREKTTHDFYVELARKYRTNHIGIVFSKLAQEELKHKYKLEKEYDDVVLKHM